MIYFIWFFIISMIASIILLGIKARKAISIMQAEVNKLRNDNEKIEILWSYDANKVINEYKKAFPKGRILPYYRIIMTAFFFAGICFADLFLFILPTYLNIYHVGG